MDLPNLDLRYYKDLVSFGDLEPGLFLHTLPGGQPELCFKSEYNTENGPEAYVVDTGEFFTGGEPDAVDRLSLQVRPVRAVEEEDNIPPFLQAMFDALKDRTHYDPSPDPDPDASGMSCSCAARIIPEMKAKHEAEVATLLERIDHLETVEKQADLRVKYEKQISFTAGRNVGAVVGALLASLGLTLFLVLST